MKSIFPVWMPNADIASACFILGVLLLIISLGMSRDVTKQTKHEHMVLWYGSDVLAIVALLCWLAMIGFLGGWL